MAIFAVRSQNKVRVERCTAPWQLLLPIVASLALAAGLAQPSHADTSGNLGGTVFPLPTYRSVSDMPFAPPTTPPFYGFIQNEYLFVALGDTGSWGNGNDAPGRIAIGNREGSLRTSADNDRSLMGYSDGRLPAAIWPYPYSNATNGASDYPAYLRALVDGNTQVNVGWTSTNTLLQPLFRPLSDGPALVADYGISNGNAVHIQLKLKLIRGMAQFTWTIVNNDTQVHTVALRWTANMRRNTGNGFLGGTGAAGGYFFRDPNGGVSDRAQVYGFDYSDPTVLQTAVPETVEVFGQRADVTTGLAPNKPFHALARFIGRGATPPNSIYMSDSIEMWPGGTTPSGSFNPRTPGIRVPYFEQGIAMSAYYGGPRGYSIPPGGQQTVVIYYGNGAASELPDGSIVAAADGPESLQYNTKAAIDPSVAGNTSATLQTVGAKFLTGGDSTGTNAFRISASISNQTLRNPKFEVPFSGVNASLTLQPGLKFAPGEVSTKAVIPTGTDQGSPGEIRGDQDATVSWLVEPTGTKFGVVTYQVAFGIAKPSPLSRTISRSINIPTPPLVELVPGTFQMVGFPFQFDAALSNNSDPDTIVNSLSRPIDDPVVFYRWIPDPLSSSGAGRYEVAKKLEPGIAYFYRPSVSGAGGMRLIYLKGAQPVAQQAPTGSGTPKPLQLDLEAGWNMISNPYVYDIPLNYLRIVPRENNPGLVSQSFADAVRNGLIRGGIFYYDALEGGYRFFEDLSAPIKPWQGYWLYTNAKVDVLFANPTLRNSLILPDPNPEPGKPAEPATRKQMLPNRWSLDLVARRSDGKQDLATQIGVGAAARSLPKPPSFGTSIDVTLDEGGAGRYAQVIKSGATKTTWQVGVTSDKDGAAKLLWPRIASVPRQVRLTITDLQTGVTKDLRSGSGIDVNLREGVTSRYQITAVAESSRPLAITGFRSAGGTRGSQASYAFQFGLTAGAQISAEVVTFTGRPIQRLAEGRSAQVGENRLVWNGRDGSGAPVPVGAYTVRLRATGADGSQSVVTLPVMVAR
jgi:hypothetical protein